MYKVMKDWVHILIVKPFHYVSSKEGIDRIQQIAADNNLTVVPLVQTFGHFEVNTNFI